MGPYSGALARNWVESDCYSYGQVNHGFTRSGPLLATLEGSVKFWRHPFLDSALWSNESEMRSLAPFFGHQCNEKGKKMSPNRSFRVLSSADSSRRRAWEGILMDAGTAGESRYLAMV